MSRFDDLASMVFPEYEPGMVRNPLHLPPKAKEVLALVACQTGVDINWLERLSGLVLQGITGCQCLWFLHGASGRIRGEPPPPRLAIEGVKMAYFYFVAKPKIEKSESLVSSEIVDVDWGQGKVIIENGWSDKPPRVVEMKLGRLLGQLVVATDKLGFEEDSQRFEKLLHEFEVRDPGDWEWRISAHPFDVLTMSYRRAWTSCCRPPDPQGRTEESQREGEYMLGPLTDMAAGSALLFFHRPGAQEPCGRVLLRPVITSDGFPAVNVAPKGYGCGPEMVIPQEIGQAVAEATGIDVIFNAVDHCQTGDKKRALSRWTYDDTPDRHGHGSGCEQSDEEYDIAYKRLLEAEWPKSNLDLGDLRRAANEALQSYGNITLKEVIESIIDERAEAWHIHETLPAMQFILKGSPAQEDLDVIHALPGMSGISSHRLLNEIKKIVRTRVMRDLPDEWATIYIIKSNPNKLPSADYQRLWGVIREVKNAIVNVEFYPGDDEIPSWWPEDHDIGSAWGVLGVPSSLAPSTTPPATILSLPPGTVKWKINLTDADK